MPSAVVRRICAGLLVGWLALVCAPARAALPQSLRFERIGVDQGLPQETATAIVQDRQGFMWIGSQDGLARFDGYRFVVFRNRPDDPHSLADNWVTALREDGDGRLWIGTRSAGVMRQDIDPDTFVRYMPPDTARRGIGALQVRAMIRASGAPATAHALWIATADGLERLDTRTGAFRTWHHEAGRSGSLASDNVLALALDRTGALWIGSDAGLDRLRPDGQGFDHFPITSGEAADEKPGTVTALQVDSRNRLWIGTPTGIQCWNLDAKAAARKLYGAADGAPADKVQAIVEDRKGTIWVGTWASGLFRLAAGSERFTVYRHDLRDPRSLAEDDVESLFQDRTGTLWVGAHAGGISRVDLASGGFTRYVDIGGVQGSRQNDKVYAVTTDPGGQLWLGTVGGGLVRLDPVAGTTTVYRHDPAHDDSLPDDFVRAVRVDDEGKLWVGTGHGLALLDPRSGRFRTRHFGGADTELDAIRRIVPASGGAFWIGTDAGLLHYDPTTDAVRVFRHDPQDPASLSPGRVTAILIDRKGVLWVGTDGGLDRGDPASGHFTHYRHDPTRADSLVHDRIHYLFEDRSGQVWVGTSAGLDRLIQSAAGGVRFHAWTRADGLGADPIGAIAQDGAGHLWISTTAGISRFDPARGTFRNYQASDGLLDGSYYVGSAHAGSDGMLYFGGQAGLTAFRPDAIHDNPSPPAVVITQLQVFNHPVDAAHEPRGVEFNGSIENAKSLRLSHANTVFSLEFAALHYADPARNRYAYRLVGFDPAFIPADASRRFVTYTNLDPGQYTFEVKASNKDGVWNRAGTALAITILPPFWATWWFRALAGAALLASLYAIIRVRERRLTRQRGLLEAQVNARTTEAVEQKEAIERSFATLSVLGDIGREITTRLDQDAILHALDRHVHELLDATTFVIYLLDADGQGLTSALRKESGQELDVHHIRMDHPTANTARCARERSQLHIELEPEIATRNYLPGTVLTLSLLYAPLAIGERLLGVMTIQSPQAHAYGERERLAFRTLCAYGAIALDNAAAYRRLAETDAAVQRMLREQQAWLESEVKARTAEVERQKATLEQAHGTLSVLGEIGREITSVLDAAEVCRILDQRVNQLLDATAFAVYLLDADGTGLTSVLRVEQRQLLPPARYPLDDPTSVTARCARERREVLPELTPAAPSQEPGTLTILSALFAPLLIGERLLGVMTIQSPREHAYGDRERLVFRTMSAYGAIALDNAAAYRRLAEADAEVQRVMREQQAFLEQEVQARTAEVVRQKEDIERSHSTLSVLGQIGRQITAQLDVAAVCRTLDRHVQSLLDAESFVIYLLDSDGRSMTSVLFVERGEDVAPETIALADPVRHAARCAREARELLLDWEPDSSDPSHLPQTLLTFSALFAPLTIGERLLGVVTIQSSRRHAYGEREQLAFRTLCAYGAIALDNAIAYRHLAQTDARLQSALREQQAIYDNAAAAIVFIKDGKIHRCNRAMEEMLGWEPGELIGQPTQVYHADHASWEAMEQQVMPLIGSGQVAEGELEATRKDGRRLWVAYRGRALDTSDLAQGSIWVSSDITERKRSQTALLEAKQQLEHGLAEVEQLNRQITLLGEMTGFLQACPTVEDAFVCIGRFGPRLFPDSTGCLYLEDAAGEQWIQQGCWRDPRAPESPLADAFQLNACWALRRHRPHRVDSLDGALCCTHLAPEAQRHPYACLPLTAQGRTFGVLFIEHHRPHDATEAERRFGLAVAMAEQVALALANVQLREALLQQSIRDPLTGLHNRRHLQEVLPREVELARRNGSRFAVLMIDVDHFKQFNDTFGHHAGDLVLQHVARVIQARVRRSDVACRYGGEEFTVLLPDVSIEQAVQFAQQLLEGFREIALHHEDRPLDRITASFGLALFPDHGGFPEHLIEAADAALYRAKEAGRNRVEVSTCTPG